MSDALTRGIEICRQTVARVKTDFADICTSERHHDFDSLALYCRQNGIELILDESLAGTRARAASILVQDVPFILLDRELTRPGERLTSLAHELGHVMLDHLRRPSFAVCGFCETMSLGSRMLQKRYCAEIELEADVHAMLIVLPEGFLHRQVERTGHIPARRLHRSLDLPLSWVGARIQLYRLVNGYADSNLALVRLGKDPSSLIERRRRQTLELEHRTYLYSLLRHHLEKPTLSPV
ncbi:MAG: ImmA/IrrE family metallo-endopeptidase [candidate division WOR-3 bacterium]